MYSRKISRRFKRNEKKRVRKERQRSINLKNVFLKKITDEISKENFII